jgi:hypothetical protein
MYICKYACIINFFLKFKERSLFWNKIIFDVGICKEIFVRALFIQLGEKVILTDIKCI